MLDLPIRSALQEIEFPLVGVERQPAPLTARSRDLVVRISHAVKAELPMFAGLIGQMLRLTRDGIDLTTRSTNFLDDTLMDIAP